MPGEQEAFHFCDDKRTAHATLLRLASICKISARRLQSSCYSGVNRLQDGEHFVTHLKLKFGKGFRVRIGNRNSRSVISGSGAARVNEHRYKLSKGVLMLIEHGDQHEIRNTGRTLLRRSTST
jgi:mannose-6-phosphate isomerase-like protein (cupin superfamily)